MSNFTVLSKPTTQTHTHPGPVKSSDGPSPDRPWSVPRPGVAEDIVPPPGLGCPLTAVKVCQSDKGNKTLEKEKEGEKDPRSHNIDGRQGPPGGNLTQDRRGLNPYLARARETRTASPYKIPREVVH